MKVFPFQPEFIFVVVIFILILFVSSYGSSINVMPYVPTKSTLPHYPYEGFDSNPESLDPEVEENPILDAPRSEYLKGYPLNETEKPYDPISSILTADHESIGKGSNLSNRMGSIHFNRETLGLINSRGGNQTVPYTDAKYKIHTSE
jgi:hypothetical protein